MNTVFCCCQLCTQHVQLLGGFSFLLRGIGRAVLERGCQLVCELLVRLLRLARRSTHRLKLGSVNRTLLV